MTEALPDSGFNAVTASPILQAGKVQPWEKRLFPKKEARGGLATEISTQSLPLTCREDVGL